MAEREVERASSSRPFVIQVTRPNPGMDPDRKIEHLCAEVNRALALLATQLEELRAALGKA